MVHYQRPGSVVHYYQQVGRAGRAVPEAFGILLAGEEDQEISDYFIRTAFPSLEQVNAILAALRASDGMTTYELQREVNLSWGAIEKALRLLSVETPSPVTRVGGRWSATPVAYAFDEERVVRLTELRQAEQEDVLPCFLSPWPSTLCPQANELVFPMDLSNDAKTALLLCGIFPDREEARPLSPGEFSKLLTWLGANGLRPGELVQPGGDDLARSISITGLENKRLADLLKRGAAMAFAVEKWLAGGLWIVTRTDPYYPRRLADRLGHQAPPLLYGAGPCDLLDHGGLAVVGSRNVDSQGSTMPARRAGTVRVQELQ